MMISSRRYIRMFFLCLALLAKNVPAQGSPFLGAKRDSSPNQGMMRFIYERLFNNCETASPVAAPIPDPHIPSLIPTPSPTVELSSVPTDPCNPEESHCTFENSIVIYFDNDHNYLLSEELVMETFSDRFKQWINNQALCEGGTDFYDEFDFNATKSLKYAKSGKGKGLCKGKSCPKKYVVQEPYRRSASSQVGANGCPSFFYALQAFNPPYFADISSVGVRVNDDSYYDEGSNTPSISPTQEVPDSASPTFGYPTPGQPGPWNQVGSDITGSPTGYNFGYAVALTVNGGRLCAAGSGTLRVFNFGGSGWSQEVDLSVYFSSLISDVAISSDGQYLIAGEPDYNGRTGAALAFNQVDQDYPGYWNKKGQTLGGEEPNEAFGTSVAINDAGDMISVGAPGGDYVKILKTIGYDWGDQIKLESDDDSYFGNSLSMADNDRIIIGAPDADVNGENSGTCFFYKLSDGYFLQKINGDNTNDNFGINVVISNDGSYAAVGSVGYVQILNYSYYSDEFKQVGLTIYVLYGSVALSADGGLLAVGSPLNDNDAGINSGKTYIYTINGYDFELIDTILGEASGDESGNDVALSANGETVIIGAFKNDDGGSDSGHVRVYQPNNDA